jgi:nucleotide-binding universal stress UspA family protein
MPRRVIDFQAAPVNLVDTMNQTSADSEKAMLQYADFLVGQARMNALDCGAQDVDARAVLGSPAEEVVDFASDRKADLIVCGSRSFGRLKSLLLGSTSHKISQLAECSCLTVK